MLVNEPRERRDFPRRLSRHRERQRQGYRKTERRTEIEVAAVEVRRGGAPQFCELTSGSSRRISTSGPEVSASAAESAGIVGAIMKPSYEMTLT